MKRLNKNKKRFMQDMLYLANCSEMDKNSLMKEIMNNIIDMNYNQHYTSCYRTPIILFILSIIVQIISILLQAFNVNISSKGIVVLSIYAMSLCVISVVHIKICNKALDESKRQVKKISTLLSILNTRFIDNEDDEWDDEDDEVGYNFGNIMEKDYMQELDKIFKDMFGKD